MPGVGSGEQYGQQPYVLIETIHTPKYLDQFLTALHATFTMAHFCKTIETRGSNPMF